MIIAEPYEPLTESSGEQKLKNVYDVFTERGFVEQVTDEAELRDCCRMNALPVISALIQLQQVCI